MILGYALAAAGAVLSGGGSVLESLAVQRAGAFGGDSGTLGRVAGQPLYWTGVASDLLGFVSAAAALGLLPLFLVQPVMAFSVGITAAISALLGAPLGRRGWLALAVAVLGLVLVGLSARPGSAPTLAVGWRLLLLVLVVPVVAIGYFAGRTQDRRSGLLLAFGAGLGFSVVAVSARTLHLSGPFLSWLGNPGLWALVANGVAATVLFAQALQKGTPTTVSAVTFTTDTALPAAVGLALLHDSLRSGWTVPGTTGFVLAIGGAIALAHYSDRAGPPKPRSATPRPAPAAVR